MSWSAMLCYNMVWYVMVGCVVLWYDRVCYVMVCYCMSRYVMLCCVVLWYVMILCDVILWYDMVWYGM